DMSEAVFAKRLYTGNAAGLRDRLMLGLAAARGQAAASDKAMEGAGGYGRLLKFAGSWQRPRFPLAGADLKRIGAAEGKTMGDTLKALEAEWVESGFALDRDALLKRAGDLLAGGGASPAV
ncbi:MAG: CCA tRNA nucleotidyltransferase, partial [Mesorhizobium sp.]|nr:CCA tRNA nucleotidyltransferase [Mesorhizobium sp.]